MFDFHVFRFMVDRKIYVVGFGLYGSIHGPSDYTVNIQVQFQLFYFILKILSVFNVFLLEFLLELMKINPEIYEILCIYYEIKKMLACSRHNMVILACYKFKYYYPFSCNIIHIRKCMHVKKVKIKENKLHQHFMPTHISYCFEMPQSLIMNLYI